MPAETLTLTVDASGTEIRIGLEGVLDLQTGPQLVALLQTREQWQEPTLVVVDLTRVTFLDSSGLVALLTMYEAFGERLRIVIGDRLEPVIEYAAARSFLPIESGDVDTRARRSGARAG